MHMLELSPFIRLGYTRFGNTVGNPLLLNIIRLLLLDLLKTEAQKARKPIGVHPSYNIYNYKIVKYNKQL